MHTAGEGPDWAIPLHGVAERERKNHAKSFKWKIAVDFVSLNKAPFGRLLRTMASCVLKFVA